MPQRRVEIAPESFNANVCSLFADDWLLLCSGDFDKGSFNMMTVGWGSIGAMWSKPFAMAVVRPQRHTYKFMEDFGSFTLCAFPEEFKPALALCGAKSGKESDKVKESGLTPVKSSLVAAPSFDEAELVIECSKSYFNDLVPQNILAPEVISRYYPQRDFHRMYFGEILAIRGTEKYIRN